MRHLFPLFFRNLLWYSHSNVEEREINSFYHINDNTPQGVYNHCHGNNYRGMREGTS